MELYKDIELSKEDALGAARAAGRKVVAIGGGSMMEIFSNGPDEPGMGAIRHMAFAVEDVDACNYCDYKKICRR